MTETTKTRWAMVVAFLLGMLFAISVGGCRAPTAPGYQPISVRCTITLLPDSTITDSCR